MDSWIDRQHRLRLRAERVAQLLVQLWGDRPPPAENPQLTTLIDAVAGDDEHGREDQLVVHGDNLTYRQLAHALQHAGPAADALHDLPPDLARRLTDSGLLPAGRLSAGMSALPDDTCGAWELDTATGAVSFDALGARLIGVGHQAGARLLPEHVDAQLHPDDRVRVTAALEESLRTGRPFEERFRARMPDGSHAWRASRARVLTSPGTGTSRLIGFIAADD